MLLVLFQEAITSLCYINILRIRSLAELVQHLQANQAHCIPGWPATSRHVVIWPPTIGYF